MEIVKNPRFWITLTIIVAAGVLAALKVMSSGEFTALVAGMLVRFSADKATTGKDDITPKAVTIPFVAVVFAATVLLGGCCSTPRCYLARGLTAVEAADKIAAPSAEKICVVEVQKCGHVPPEQCAAFKKCDMALKAYQAAMDALGRALAAANRALANVGVR